MEEILESIEKNSNAVRAQTDRIVGAASAATFAAWGVVQVAGIGLGIAGLVFFLYAKYRPKYEEWKQQRAPAQSAALQPEDEQLVSPPQQQKTFGGT